MRQPRWQAIAIQRPAWTLRLTVNVLWKAPARFARVDPQCRASLCGGPTPSQTISLGAKPLPTNVKRPPGATIFGLSLSRGFAMLAVVP